MTFERPLLDRRRFFAEIRHKPEFDALIVGGGITGAGTFRELSAQGLRCLLVERSDFASGASGALSRVAQGGFRYLEKGELGLVRRAVTERNRFVAAAPHQTKPIRLVIPCETLIRGLTGAMLRVLRLRSGHSLPGALILRAAVVLYENLGRKTRQLPSGGLFTRNALRQRYPGISPHYRAAVYEYEAIISAPERIVVELIEEAVAEDGGSVALNYAQLQPEVGFVLVGDRLSEERAPVRARVIINAAGANVDRIAKQFGIDTKLVDGVAGTHLLLHAPHLARAIGADLLFFEDANPISQNRRLCFVYSVGANLLLGATETPVAEPDSSRPTPADDDYLLSALRHLFPGAGVEASNVVGRLHGVRPLVCAAGEDVTGRSRDHAVHTHAATDTSPPIVSIAGGKWTTFRTMAADTADAAMAVIGHARRVFTEDRPIGGGRDFPKDADDRDVAAHRLAERFVIAADLAQRLIATYGSRADRVAAYLVEPAARATIGADELTVGEVRFFAREEMACTADDVARRRTRLFLESKATPGALAEIERVVSQIRGGEDQQQSAGAVSRLQSEEVEHAAV